MAVIVPPSGPLDARLVVVGEAPGRWEELHNPPMPFVGATGYWLRKELQLRGVDPETVRFTNTCRINPGTFPTGKAGAQLLVEWAPTLDEELRALTACKVLVLCGGRALQRLTGYTDIGSWRGSVLRPADLPPVAALYHSKAMDITWPVVLPAGCEYVMPMLHPAGMMYTKSRKDTVVLKRDVERVAAALYGELKEVVWTGHYGMAPARVREAIYGM